MAVVAGLLTLICIIPKVNLGVGEMCFISFSKITLRRGYKFDKIILLTSFLSGDTSDLWNSSLLNASPSKLFIVATSNFAGALVI